MADVSIIIPTLNEGICLSRTLRYLSILEPPAKEIIVVDGGSTDETVAIAQSAIIQSASAQSANAQSAIVSLLHSSKASRSIQMNLGAKQASGDFLCFVHGDTLVPDDLATVITDTLANTEIAGGGFVSLMTGKKTRWGTSLHNGLKTYYAPLIFRPLQFFKGLRLLFGDQVIFCRRQDFIHCGGFNDDLSIMEDADLCIQLAKIGRIQQVNRIVQSSDRRVAKWGSFKANAIYFCIGTLWGIGVSAQTLKRFYEDVR